MRRQFSEKAAHAKDLRAPIAPMQHRHFATIARIIRETDPSVVPDRYSLAREFAETLRKANPNFDYSRFVDACVEED